jgi:hypothetical protein
MEVIKNCSRRRLMTVLAMILSGLSALVWLTSALIRIPVVFNLAGRVFLSGPRTDEPREYPFLPVLRYQSKLNAIAAFLMFFAVVPQALSYMR